MINSKTKLCCVIGNPIEQSISPLVHNAAYKALGLNYVFLAFKVTQVKEALEGLKAMNVTGISVTIPHKLEVLKYVDEVDKVAAEIGAANTIVNKEGRFIATNTDWIGALKALEKKTSLSGKRIALLGAGGAARALIYGLVKRGAKVTVFNRTKVKAHQLAKYFQLEGTYLLSDIEKIKKAEIIINTTSVGMIPNISESPIPNECINSSQIIFDIINKPYETKLLQYAKIRGATIIHGYEMLLYGAAEQFQLFTGKAAPVKIMENAILQNLVHKYA